jgi:uncharacterized iron-regulated membrane protein
MDEGDLWRPGVVMWWKRRPAGSLRAVLGIAVAVSLAFPLTGLAIVAFAAIDFLCHPV